VRFPSGSLKLRGRVASVRLQCIRAAACRGVLRLSRGRVRFASRSFSLKAGQSKTIRVKLSRSALKRLRAQPRRRVAARAQLRGRAVDTGRRLTARR